MSVGLIALLDDVAAIAKLAASSLDDVMAQGGRAAAKASGVVIDDAAVTPQYVMGFHPARELPIVGRIALGSLRNKLLILLPIFLLLVSVAPWVITPLVMLGGGYLCYEGAEKALEWLRPGASPQAGPAATQPGEARVIEDQRVAGAIRTDLILSAEIMAITVASMPEAGFWMRAAVLALVGIAFTVLVYGAVAMIVKADDIGLALASRPPGPFGTPARVFGRAVVRGMPGLLKLLSVAGTLAMLWVGGGIILHGLEELGFGALSHALHALAHGIGAAEAAISAVFGLLLGLVLVALHHLLAGITRRDLPASATPPR